MFCFVSVFLSTAFILYHKQIGLSTGFLKKFSFVAFHCLFAFLSLILDILHTFAAEAYKKAVFYISAEVSEACVFTDFNEKNKPF